MTDYLIALKYHRRDSRGDKANHYGDHCVNTAAITAVIPVSGAAYICKSLAVCDWIQLQAVVGLLLCLANGRGIFVTILIVSESKLRSCFHHLWTKVRQIWQECTRVVSLFNAIF